MPDDAQLLDDLIAKLREMQEQLSMAEMEASSQTLLRGRIRHLYILATYMKAKLEGMATAKAPPPQAGDNASPGTSDRR
jgi:hypothetical protein